MTDSATGFIGTVIGRWVDRVRVYALWVVLLSVAATAVFLTYTVKNLGVTTDTADMISPDLPWRQDYLAYKRAFPQYFEEVVIVVEGVTPETAGRAAEVLEERLREEKTLFRTVYAPGGEEFFRRNGLLYLDMDELLDLADNLALVQPFLGTLVRDMSLPGLASMLDTAMDAVTEGEEVDLAPVLAELSGAFEAAVVGGGGFYRVSWRGLMGGEEPGPDDLRRFIIVQPSIDFSGLQGEAAIKRIRQLAGELGLTRDRGVTVRLTGSVAIANDELKTVSRGAEITGIAALLAVGIILLLGLGSVRLMAASMYTLVTGLVATAAFATWAIGTLNLISVAFAVLYIGLGIDYAIHLSLRYRELVAGGAEHGGAIRSAASEVGRSLVICAVTTSAGFFAFVPTAYSGVSELGVIAGTGMGISLVANLTVLPAVLSLFPLNPGKTGRRGVLWSPSEKLASALVRRKRWVWTVVAVLTVASAALLPRARFSYDPMALRDESTESVATFKELMETSSIPLLTISVLEDDPGRARMVAERLKALDTVDKAVTIFDFVPKNQEEKFALIEEMALLMGPELEPTGDEGAPVYTLEDKVASIINLSTGIREFLPSAPPETVPSAERLLESIGAFERAFEEAEPGIRERMVRGLEESILADLPRLLDDLRTSLEADHVTFEDLPGDLVERRVSGEGLYLVEVFPEEDISDDNALKRFVSEVRGVVPGATGAPVFILEAGSTVIAAFEQAFIYALVVIVIILLLLLRNIVDAVLVLLPMLLAGLYTAAGTVVFGVPFNFANTIALPLILGIGVDNGVHMVSRARIRAVEPKGLLATSTARAVFYSALTTVASFGGLGFSPHPGTASIGTLLAIGITLTLVVTLVFLPTLLVRMEKGSSG